MSTSVAARRSRVQSNSVRQTIGAKTLNILDLSKESKKEFLLSFDFVFCACDGVIWMLAGEIPNTGPALMLLKEWGKEIIFVSNNSMRKDKEYLEKFQAIGFPDVNPNNIIHPVKIISRYIKRNMAKKSIFSLCSREMNEVFRKHEVNVRTMQPNLNLTSETLLEKIAPDERFDAVVLDLNFNLTFGELMRAHQYLLNENCDLLVGAADSRLPVSKGFKALGSAGFLNILLQSSGKEPIVFGKPGAHLAEYLIERFRLIDRPERALFIGDNLSTDIAFGISHHFKTMFVPTGAYTIEEVKKLPEHLQPDYFAKSLADFTEFFGELKIHREEWIREAREAREAKANEERPSTVSRQSDGRASLASGH